MNYGLHIRKNGSYYNSLIKFYRNSNVKLPCQLFTGSNKSWKSVVPADGDIEKTNKFVTGKDVFVHSKYLVNLARPFCEFVKGRESLEFDLKYGGMLGFKGVVVHVGKRLKMDNNIAQENMFRNILCVLLNATKECPLVLETPAGQGTEMLTDIIEFIGFYNKFDSIHKEKLKICIDTCHVWSLGYEPLEYIKTVQEKLPGSLVLVHFNDSKGPKGCRKDRHELPGLGEIGKNRMLEISQHCLKTGIPMVTEN